MTISFAGEFLQNAEELIRMGLHPSEIISGYNKARKKASYALVHGQMMVRGQVVSMFVTAMKQLIKREFMMKVREEEKWQSIIWRVTLIIMKVGQEINDCLLFVRATSKAANNISNLLENFSTASGQKINLHKSTVFFSANVHNRAIITLSNLLQIQHKTTLGRYLGIHNIVSWKDPDNTKLMIKRIRNKFAGWKAQTLSRAGRLTLIKASVSRIPNHTLA
ncbi:hypothetical protein GBA52_003729 [Prunus armeniaca]|nr:hypothetical protein GBA52_003729 [Prunus armeniaca]